MAETVYYVDTDVSGGAADGSSWANAYSSLNQAEQARDADITGENAVVFSCKGVTNADTAAVSISGWTTDADSYVKVYCASGNGHVGTKAGWQTAKYRLSVTDAIALTISEDYVRIDGLQIETVSPTAASRNIIAISGITATNNALWVSNCILKGHGHATHTQRGVNDTDADTIAYFWNDIIYNIAAISSNYGMVTAGTISIYSSTIIGGAYCIYVFSGTTTAKNVYVGGSATEDFYLNATTLAKTNCASDDGSADDTKTGETQSNCVPNIAVSTDTAEAGFVNVTAGSEDFHIKDGSQLQGVGADTSGDTAPLNFTTDIDGDTRS